MPKGSHVGMMGWLGAAEGANNVVSGWQQGRAADGAKRYKQEQDRIAAEQKSRQLADQEEGTRISRDRFNRDVTNDETARADKAGLIKQFGMLVDQNSNLTPEIGQILKFAMASSGQAPVGQMISASQPQKPEARTDYGDFLVRFAKERGKTADALTVAEETEARKTFNQADDRPQRPLPPQVFIMPGPTGPILIDKNTGTSTPVKDAGTGNTIGPTPSAGAREAVATNEAGIDRLDKIEKAMNPAWIGPAAGRINTARQKLPDMPGEFDDIDPAMAEFYADVAGNRNDMIRLITGAAVGVQEEKRIREEIPDVTDRPEVFKAKLAATRRNRATLTARVAGRTGVGGNGGGAKVLTEQDIQSAMTANQWTREQAIAEAKKRGFTVR